MGILPDESNVLSLTFSTTLLAGEHAMTQNDLYQSVAEVTGEDIAVVRQRGFSLVNTLEEDHFDFAERAPLVVDWDALDRERNVALFEQPPFRRIV